MKPIKVSFEWPLDRNSRGEILFLSGTRDRKSALDTLKKISPAGGFFQVLSPSRIGSPTHLAWAAYSAFLAVATKKTHYSKPELEFLVRVAGVSQVEKALPLVGVSPSLDDVVVVWAGPAGVMNPSTFEKELKKWGLNPKTVALGTDIHPPSGWSLGKEIFAIEKSALVK
jgi:hypothetical protein